MTTTTTKLQSPSGQPAIAPLSGWWRKTVELELAIEYRDSSPLSRQVWDDLVAKLMLQPSELFYRELGECLQLWQLKHMTFASEGTTFLDAFVAVSFSEGLTLSDHALLAAFKLRSRLSSHRRYFVGPLGVK